MQLSKSRYIRGVQCPKMLWMLDHMPEQFDDSVLNESVLQTGDEVGDLAMGYYGDFVEIPFSRGDFPAMADMTRKLIDEGASNICEATFIHDMDLCLVDILRVFDGYVELVEVKSSTSVHDIYLHDIAYQVWLLRQCGLDVRRASLMHVDSSYVRGEELDLHGLFKVEDVTEDVEGMLADVPGNIQRFKDIGDGEGEPVQKIGTRCFKPYECGFRGWCWRDVPAPSVFDLSRIRKERAFDRYRRGVVSFDDLIDSGEIGLLTDRQQMQVLCEVEGGDVVDGEAIRSFLDELWYPLHFLDFESFQLAVPEYPGTKPFQQIPTQYSLHVIEREDGEVSHKELLAKEGRDPRREVAEGLVRDIPAHACVLAWNMGFEKGRIRELAEAFPDLAPRLMAIHDNVRDLMLPFSKGDYYTKEMQGSASIKKVLPALFPDDPELDYHALEGVHNGSEASMAFKNLAEHTPEDRSEIREQLLRYCELDTLAMVKIWQRLIEVAD